MGSGKGTAMPITTHSDLWAQLTLHKGVGEITVEDVEQTVRAFYEAAPTKNVLWDFTEGTLQDLTTQQIRHIMFEVTIFRVIGRADVRTGGRTAMVASNAADYGLARVAVTIGELEELPFESDVFFDIDEARQWLAEVPDVDLTEQRRKIVP